jgi:type IV pilus assembly protein PilE
MRPALAATGSARARARGVTLMELMIVVVIVAILSIVAVPSYRTYTMRANRTEAKTALLAIQLAQERFYLVNHRYGDIGDLGGLGVTGTSENGVYELEIEIDPVDANYTATATPAAGGGTNGTNMSADAECASFSIDARGVRAATGPRCW